MSALFLAAPLAAAGVLTSLVVVDLTRVRLGRVLVCGQPIVQMKVLGVVTWHLYDYEKIAKRVVMEARCCICRDYRSHWVCGLDNAEFAA